MGVLETLSDSIFLQIGCGLIPVILLLAFLCLFGKKRRGRIIPLALVFAMALASAGYGYFTRHDEENRTYEADHLRFAYTLAAEGEYDLALRTLKEARSEAGYTEGFSLAFARLFALNGDFDSAKTLYQKINAEGFPAEKDAVIAGSAAFKPSDESAETAREEILSSITNLLTENNSDAYNISAQATVFAETHYAAFIETGVLDAEETMRQTRRIDSAVELAEELNGISALRIARLKLRLLNEDWRDIAREASEDSNYQELMLLSELYINGRLPASYFPDDFGGGNTAGYEEVAEALSDIYEREFADAPREERRRAREELTALQAFLLNPSLIYIRDTLDAYTQSEFASDKSRVYIQLAKIENYMGSSQNFAEYMDKALNTVGDCLDAEFTAPMYEIISIIADKDNPERLKDVAPLIDRILSHTITFNLPENLSRPSETGASGKITLTPVSAVNPATTIQTPSDDFDQAVNSYVSQKRMSVNIVDVDISDFETVSATLNISGDQIGSLEELENLLRVHDCEIGISFFDLEKINYRRANILICADISGSMEGKPLDDLKEAIRLFAETTDDIEDVALIAFASSARIVQRFGGSSEDLAEKAGGLSAADGTDMFNAVKTALEHFTPQEDELNCVIVISDGEDNYPAGYDAIMEEIAAPYREKGITLYALGLGDSVAGEYMNTFAGATGGNYVYATDSAQIQGLFDGIRAQIMNSYRLTFRAEDTIQNSRGLRVSIEGESYTFDEHWYTLDGSPPLPGGVNPGVVYLEGKTLYGFEEKLLFKSEKSREIKFKGEGFTAEDRFVLSLIGNVGYDDLKYTFADSTTLLVTVPAGIACDTYDVGVSLNGKKTVLVSGLTVAVQGSQKRTVFGDYVFTSYLAERAGDTTRLNHYVQMNGWLNFKGEVILTGDPEGQSITLTTSDQQYVHYYPDSATGFAKTVVNRDIPIPAINGITLYNQYLFETGNDGEDGGGLRVEPVPIATMMISGLGALSSPGLSLYPDRVELNTNSFSTNLPFQEQIMKGLGLFTFNINVGGSLGATSIDVLADIGFEAGSKEGRLASSPINLGNIPLLANKSEFELKIDTRQNKYSVKLMIAIPSVTDNPSFGVSLDWKMSEQNQLEVNEVLLYADVDVPFKGSPIDLTMSNFKAGLTAMTENTPMVVGGFDLSAYKLGSALPGIGKYLGDMADISLLSANDAEVRFRLIDFYIKASTKITFLKYIEIADIQVQVGKFDYTSKLLGINNEQIKGFNAKVVAGPSIHVENCDIAFNGTLEFSGTNRFGGLSVGGNVDLAVKWWILTKEFHAQGQAFAGVRFTHDGDMVFMLTATDGRDKFFIEWSGRHGLDIGKKSL